MFNQNFFTMDSQLTPQAQERINEALTHSKFFNSVTIVAKYNLNLQGKKSKERLKDYLTKLELTRANTLNKAVSQVRQAICD